MNGLISKQAAIRWVKTECNPYGKPTLDFESGKKMIEHLEQMPSTQPELIYCQDCIYGEGPSHNVRCSKYYGMGGPDEFCSRAERRDE